MESSISKASGNFFFGTLISRFSGMFRDIFLAFFFGSSASLATFMVAFRFAHLFRRFFGESALQGGFIPHFESFDKRKSSLLYRDLFFSIIAGLLIFIILIEIVFSIASNFFYFFNLNAVKYFSIMIFGLIFISLYGLNSSLLKCQKIYFLPAVAPFMFNIVFIFSMFIIYLFSYKNIFFKNCFFLLSISVVLAFFFQMIITFFPAFRFFIKYHEKKDFFKPNIFSKNLKGLIKPFSLSILGIGAIQLNTALDSLFAKFASPEGPCYLWYASRLYQAPIGLFAVAINSAIFPSLARTFLKDKEMYLDVLKIGIKRSIFFMLFSTFGIFILGGSGVNFIFGRGLFDNDSIFKTLGCLYGYSLSLMFVSFVFIFSSSFYAEKKFSIVAKGSIYSVFLNVILNVFFVFSLKMSVNSIAFATSISAIFNAVYLCFKLDRDIFTKSIFLHFFKIFLAGIFSFSVVFLFGYFLKDATILWFLKKDILFPRNFLKQSSSFFSLSFVYLISFFFFSYLFKIKEAYWENVKKYFIKEIS